MRIALIGNCQVQTLSMIVELMVDGAETTCFDYSTSASRDETQRARFADSLADVDLILAQPAVLSHTNHKVLKQRYGSRVVTIANFYFRGLFPDSCYVGSFGERLQQPSIIHSIVVLDAFRRGASRAGALRAFGIDGFERLGLLDAWASSVEEMRQRESTGEIDVPGGEMMEEACRIYPAFLTMNHPSAPFLADYMQRVFHHIELRANYVNGLALPDPLAEHDTTPILDEIAAHYRLPYRTTQHWRINAFGRDHYVNREEFIDAFYNVYEQADPSTLRVHSPTDLVAGLGADPDLCYLVDPTRPAPPWAEIPGAPSTPSLRSSVSRDDLNTALRPLEDALTELRIYTHKIHSYLEVMDPKVEQLAYALPKLEAGAEAARRAKPGSAAAITLPKLRIGRSAL